MADIELQSRSNTSSSSTSNSNKHKKNKNMFSIFNRSGSDTEQEQRILRYDDNGEYITRESQEEVPFIPNKIKTSKYSIITFIPLNLFEQLIRPANFYFVCIAVLQSIKAVSISGGSPTILVPLTFVFTVTAIKDALEDLVCYLHITRLFASLSHDI